jgi:hypothetical protein
LLSFAPTDSCIIWYYIMLCLNLLWLLLLFENTRHGFLGWILKCEIWCTGFIVDTTTKTTS